MRASIELKRAATTVHRTLRGSSGCLAILATARHHHGDPEAGSRPSAARPQPKRASGGLRLVAWITSILRGRGEAPSRPDGPEPRRHIPRDWCVVLTSSLDGAPHHEGWEIALDEEWELEVKVEAGEGA